MVSQIDSFQKRLRYSIISNMDLLLLAYVSRTYIGGGSSSQSSLAMKIHRKSSKSQLSLLPNSGSLSSLHETALTSDAEEVRSSVSAYHPVSSYTKRSSKRYFDTLNLTLVAVYEL